MEVMFVEICEEGGSGRGSWVHNLSEVKRPYTGWMQG
jgi:hypothetical protein